MIRARSISWELVGPNDPELKQFAKRIAEKRRLNRVPRIWGYRDREGALWAFDAYEGDRVVRWIETFCRHRKGEWAGKPLILAPWQKRIVRQLFGWFGMNGLRKFREAWLEIPRKNGKSTLVSAIGLYLAIGDREPASEVYSIAGSEKQAMLVYSDARAMVEADPKLDARVSCGKNAMIHAASDSRFAAIGKSNQHGLNPHGVIGDEVHEWRTRDQFEAMTTAQLARRQPMSIFITTAGHDMSSLCGELHRKARNVLSGLVYSPDLYVRIYSAEPGDDWQDEATWHKANPGLKYGAPKIDALRKSYRKAKQSKSEENSFKRLHLNIWTDRQTAWIRGDDWRGCQADIDWSLLRGARCFAGLDLAKVQDLSALSLLFTPENKAVPGKWIIGTRFWCPEDNIRERSKSDGVDYQAWADRGLLNPTPGNATDFDHIESDILELAKVYNIEALGFDAFLAHQMIQHLMNAGISCVEVRQGFITLSPPTAELERKVISREVVHGGNEVMNWNVANVAVVMDAAGNIKPHKGKSGQKIDGVAALINAMALGMTAKIKPNISGFLSNPITSFAA